MAWVKLDDSAMDHPKILLLTDAQFRLWMKGLCYCQKHLTDGFIPDVAIKPMLGRAGDVKGICDARLWEAVSGGFQVRNYLKWNESKDNIQLSKKIAKDRLAFMRDPELRIQIQARDGYFCRYCGCRVNWLDRKGAKGATYDHVEPFEDSVLDNLVVACRGCNSRKQDRTPEQAGMTLLPPPEESTKNLEVSKFESRLRSRKLQAIIPSHPLEEEKKVQKDPTASALSVPPPTRGTQHGRIFLHRWQVEALIESLGPHAAGFDLDAWILGLSALSDREGLYLKKTVVWPWVQAKLTEEVERRGLPVATVTEAPTLSKSNTRLFEAISQLRDTV